MLCITKPNSLFFSGLARPDWVGRCSLKANVISGSFGVRSVSVKAGSAMVRLVFGRRKAFVELSSSW